MRSFKKTLFTFCLLSVVTLAGIALADEVDVKGISYEGAVQKFDPETLSLTIRVRASQFSKSLAEVTKISIKGKDDFNKAEVAAASKKIGSAIKLYAKAYKAPGKDWYKALIMFRRYQAICKLKRIDLSVKAWLGLVKRYGSTQAILAIAPSNVGSAGSKANVKALVVIDAQVKKLAPELNKNRKLIEALLNVKMAVENAQGDDSAAGLTAEMLSDLDSANLTGEAPKKEEAPAEVAADDDDENGDEEEDQDAPKAAANTNLRVLAQLLKSGNYDKVISSITNGMDSFEDDEELPNAIILFAKAQVAKAKATKDKKYLINAGLNFMIVYSEYADEPQGPEALFYAAKINGMLGQKASQKAALEELATKYAESDSKMSTWVTRATEELKKLKAKK